MSVFKVLSVIELCLSALRDFSAVKSCDSKAGDSLNTKAHKFVKQKRSDLGNGGAETEEPHAHWEVRWSGLVVGH